VHAALLAHLPLSGVNPAVLSPAAAAAPAAAPWAPGHAAVPSPASAAAAAAEEAAAGGAAALAGGGCGVWHSWALYDIKWELQVGAGWRGWGGSEGWRRLKGQGRGRAWAQILSKDPE
jgi:hypothetical protein